MKSVVIVEAEVELLVLGVGLGVGEQELAAPREAQEHVARGEGGVRHRVADEECQPARQAGEHLQMYIRIRIAGK